jgi:hypothetical protein
MTMDSNQTMTQQDTMEFEPIILYIDREYNVIRCPLDEHVDECTFDTFGDVHDYFKLSMDDPNTYNIKTMKYILNVLGALGLYTIRHNVLIILDE